MSSILSITVLVELQESIHSVPVRWAVMLRWFSSPGSFPVLLDLFHNPGVPRITALTISTSTDFYCHHSVFVDHNCSYHLNALIDYHDCVLFNISLSWVI